MPVSHIQYLGLVFVLFIRLCMCASMRAPEIAVMHFGTELNAGTSDFGGFVE